MVDSTCTSPRAAKSMSSASSIRDPQYVVWILTSYGCEKNDSGTVPPARPTIVTSASVRAAVRASSIVASVPTKSKSTSAPWPWVRSLTASAA